MTMKYFYRFKQLILLCGDFITFVGSLFLATALRSLTVPTVSKTQELLIGFILVFLLWLIVNYVVGLYDLRTITSEYKYKRIVEASIASFIVAIVFFYISPNKEIAPKTLLFFTTLISYSGIYIWRIIYPRIIGEDKFVENIVVLGSAPEFEELSEILKKQPNLGHNISAIFSSTHIDTHIQTISTIEKLIQFVKATNIQTIVVADHGADKETIEHFLYTCLFDHINIVDFATFYEHVTGRIPPSTFSRGWFLKHIQTSDAPMYKKIRRVLDIIAAAIFGVILIALSLIVIPLIKMTSPGAIFYKQKRVGSGGKEFDIYKFRTMYSLAPDGSAEIDGAQFASRGDKRITPIGNILRKTRIDELPQIINLFKGELTLIGPRPERPEIVRQLVDQMSYYTLRHTITPGLTGWAQIHQHYTDTLETSLQKLQYDLYYIKNRSLLLDMSILLKTISVVLRGLGQ